MKIKYFSLGTGDKLDEIKIILNICKTNKYDLEIYSFEMNKNNYENLLKKLKTINNFGFNIKIYNLAISNIHNKLVNYYYPSNKLESSLFKSHLKKYNTSKVNSIIFSSWIKENNIKLDDSINILKVSLNGGEINIVNDLIKNNLSDMFQLYLSSSNKSASKYIHKIKDLNESKRIYFSDLQRYNIEFKRFANTKVHNNCDIDQEIKLKVTEKIEYELRLKNRKNKINKTKNINLNKCFLNRNKIKICITHKPEMTAFGGGNQFVLSLVKFLKKKNINICYTLEPDIDLIFVMDPRKLKYNKITTPMLVSYKKKYPDVKIVQRVNDCDKPRGNVDVLDPLQFEAFKIDDFVVFVSDWTEDYYKNKGFEGYSTSINNGCDQTIFTCKEYSPLKKIKIVTHHWSDNINKGFKVYEYFDKLIEKNKNIEFTFIGRKFNSANKLKNIKVIGPFHGTELADKIKEHNIYITASQFENCPMHVVEALSCGLPILYHKNLGGGVEICKNYGEVYDDFDSLIKKLDLIVKNYEKYAKKIKDDHKLFSSDIANKRYISVFEHVLTSKLKPKEELKKHPWIERTINWCKEIEKNDFNWSLNGYNKHKLGSVSLFGKLYKTFKNYAYFDTYKIEKYINNYKDDNDIISCIRGDLNRIAECRQAFSGIININKELDIPNFDLDNFYKEPLFFMTNKAWQNPWGAGAQLSHYLFFCKIKNYDDKIEKVLFQLEKFKQKDGWYYGNPSFQRNINGIMKILTGFDIIGKKIDKQIAKNIIDLILKNKSEEGGCNLYDYVYVLIRCSEVLEDYRLEECKLLAKIVLIKILRYQQNDGGFKYNIDSEKAHRYYGEEITPDGFIGCVHPTVLFTNTFALIDNYLNLGMDLELVVS